MSDQLSRRKQQIIQILIKEQDFVSTGVISEKLNVSRRTILREIDAIEEWLSSKGVFLERKTSKGMKLLLDEKSKNLLINNINHEKIEIIYTPLERQKKIIIELLNATEAKKIYYFSSMLKVSEATISYDLDKIELLFQSWQLNLLRKPGYGISVEGRESNFRKAIIKVFNEYFDKGELLSLIKDDYIKSEELFKKTAIKKTLLDVIGYTLLEEIEEAVRTSGALETHPLADSAYAALIIHLSLAIKRLSDGDIIHFDRQMLEELSESSEYEVAKNIVKKTSEVFNISIPKDEIGYVALHLKGAKLRRNYKQASLIRVDDYEVIYLIELLIKEMESLTGYILVENQQLFSGLVNHFGPAMARIKQGIDIDNPLLNEMKSNYNKYYLLVKSASVVIEKHLGFKIPESEIAFLTMHFAAAVENIKKSVQTPWRVAIACSTGIGSSKLLEARVKKYYKNMEIVSVMSTIELEQMQIQGKYDLVITTVPLNNIDIPYVVVSPLLPEDDIRRIEIILNGLMPLRQHRKSDEDKLNLLVKLEQLPILSNASKDILNNFFIIKLDDDTIDAMSYGAARYISANHHTKEIQKELIDREKKGETYFDSQIGRLLHCRSSYVKKIHFGIVLTPSDNYAAIMIGPKKLDVVERNLLGQISMNLMDNTFFLNTLKNGNLIDAYAELEKIIHSYIKSVLD